MKQTIILLIAILGIYLILGELADKKILIPNEAIRIRVVPNSNDKYDQDVKKMVSTELQTSMFSLLSTAKNVNEARKLINSNLNLVKQNIDSLLKTQKYDRSYTLNFGYNYFPEKEFKGIKYEAGYYESLLVTLGEGKGDNWWCVLFPPLCLLEASDSTDVEYRSFVKELIDKYL
jgi:stage II sporulation protein R